MLIRYSLPPPRQFNPTAPSFSPSPSRSPNFSARTSPAQLHGPFPTPAQRSFSSTPNLPYSTPRSFTNANAENFELARQSEYQAPEMGRSGSGGVKVGNGRVIEFGDFPEKVDMREARERVERSWVAREGSQVLGLGIRRS
jgi:hypothetical protein